MKFGQLAGPQLDAAHLALPPDSPENIRVLQSSNRPARPLIYAGCAEYRVKEWKGVLYPAKLPEASMLEAYTRRFNCMEMNGTHYRIYEPAQTQKWTEKVARPGFLFLPKFPQAISHDEHSFEELQDITAGFIESIDAFRPHLGPLFLQMSEFFHPGARQAFFRYLATLPDGYTYFVELRNPLWFTNPDISAELFGALRALGIGAVITDTAGRRDIVHMHLSIPKIMVRFVGSHRHPSTAQRAAEWIERLKAWLDAGLEEVYFMVHTGLNAPITARDIIRKMNAQLDAGLPEPELFSDDPVVPAEKKA